MAKQLDATEFLAGREAYLAKTPLLQVANHVAELGDEKGESHIFGFLDGLLADIRDCAKNAREEMAARNAL